MPLPLPTLPKSCACHMQSAMWCQAVRRWSNWTPAPEPSPRLLDTTVLPAWRLPLHGGIALAAAGHTGANATVGLAAVHTLCALAHPAHLLPTGSPQIPAEHPRSQTAWKPAKCLCPMSCPVPLPTALRPHLPPRGSPSASDAPGPSLLPVATVTSPSSPIIGRRSRAC